MVNRSWTARHFSLSNPRGAGETDLPKLLRRVADEIEARGVEPGDILDLSISHEITSVGPSWRATLYWSPDDASSP